MTDRIITSQDSGEHVAHVYPSRLNLQVHGLRGLSALLVFVFHIYEMAEKYGFWPVSTAFLYPSILVGRHGVELFFIISGFLITGSLLRHGSVKQFLIDRAIRIYPVFLTIHLLVFVTGPLIHYKWMAGIGLDAWLTAFFENLLFLPGIFDLPLAQLSAWSLSYEAAFYLISAAAYLVARKADRRFVIAALALLLLPLLWLYPKASFFLVGVAIFFIGDNLSKRHEFLEVLALPAFVATLLMLYLSEWWPGLAYPACIPAFIFFCGIVRGAGMLSRFLRSRFLQYTGTLSFSFYLWSAVVTYPLKVLVTHVPVVAGLRLLIFAVLSTAASYVVSALSQKYLEDGARKFFKSRRKKAPPIL
jgi:peptidoglycan/LPS O-acetylase OafA/YrhL